MPFKVVLFSRNRNLANACREVLTELFGKDWTLVVCGSDGVPAQYDICIWDFVPGEIEIPEHFDPEQIQDQFFVLQRKHLPALRELTGTPHLNILLKPVTNVTLSAFLGAAARHCRERNADTAVSSHALREERDQMLQCLIQANLKLQEYDHDRTNFLARSIHDFRAPLTAISGYCGLLLEEQLGDLTVEQREILERMQHSTKRLSRMAHAMFQLSIGQNVEQKLNFQKGDVRECIDQAVHEIAPFADDKRITVTIDVEPPPDLLSYEKSQLEQALINLLDNACKFTPRSGSIEIRGYPFFWDRRFGRTTQIQNSGERRLKDDAFANSYRIDIRDSGPGIPPAQIERIFEEYTSYAGGKDRSGGGLGLAICKMIVRLHQGRVWAENTPSGTRFSIVLPFERSESLERVGKVALEKMAASGGI